MGDAMDFGLVLRFLLKTLGAFAIIFIIAMITPKLAQTVDGWIKKYRRNHDPKKDETYGIRSIYELPPRPHEDTEDEDPYPEDEPLPDIPAEMAEILREDPLPAEEPPEEPAFADEPEPEIEPEAEIEPEPVIDDVEDDLDDEDEFDDEDDFDDDEEFDDEEEDFTDEPETTPEPAPAPAEAAEESIPWFLR